MALKIGSEDRRKVAIAVILGVVVLFLVLRALFAAFGSGTPPAPLPPTIARTSPASPATTGPAVTAPALPLAGAHEATKVSGSMAGLDPTLHPEWMAAAESLKYAGKGRNIFSMESAPVIEAPKAPVRPSPQEIAVAQAPPPPPPIDLKFFGYEAHAGGERKAFLLHGDDIFIAAMGDVVDHRYKILQIAPFSIQVQDIPYNDTQTLQLVQN
ncbi:MAG TPA: hypothetical protein VFW25_02960 [Silvibacterium sp.]|nr:hypothetical protein [Silvibacterium sp.]